MTKNPILKMCIAVLLCVLAVVGIVACGIYMNYMELIIYL